jgi:2-aminoadipate transaminase
VLAKQLPILRSHYQHKRDVMVEALKKELGTSVSWPDPRGGFFLWATLPENIDSDAMIARAVEHGVIYVSGDAFFVDGRSGRNIIRLSFSAPTPERIQEGVSRLAATIRDELAVIGPAAKSSAASPAAR